MGPIATENIRNHHRVNRLTQVKTLISIEPLPQMSEEKKVPPGTLKTGLT